VAGTAKNILLLLSLLASLVLTMGNGFAGEPVGPEFRLPDRSLYFQGRHIYERRCVLCHGKRGNGQGEMSVGLEPKPRSFVKAEFKYRSTPYGKLPTTEDLVATVKGGVSGTGMGMFTTLSDREVRAVVEYVKFFSPKWRDVDNQALPIEVPPVPAWMTHADKDQQRLNRGRLLFGQTCVPCHGEAGDGNGPNAGELKDHLGRPIRPANLVAPHLRTGIRPEQLFKTISTGLNGTPMPGFHGVLSGEQRWEIIAHILRLRSGNNR